MATNETTYKGSPVLELNSESKFPFSFGLKKAELILQNLGAIREFVAKHSDGAIPDDPGFPAFAGQY